MRALKEDECKPDPPPGTLEFANVTPDDLDGARGGPTVTARI